MAGYWGAGPPPDAADLFDAAERLGIDQVWTAEAYGSDAWTPLAWYGSRTSSVRLGTAVSQLSARPPATLAMTAMTMDHLTRGRVMLGVGPGSLPTDGVMIGISQSQTRGLLEEGLGVIMNCSPQGNRSPSRMTDGTCATHGCI